MTSKREETSQQLVDGGGQAVDVVAVPLQLSLVAAALAPGQLGNGDGDEDHQQAGCQVFLVRLALGGGGLLQCCQEVRIHLAGVSTSTGELCHEAGLVRRSGVTMEVFDGRCQEWNPFLQLI